MSNEKTRNGIMFKTLKPIVFWPPFTLLIISAIYSITAQEEFLGITTDCNQWILKNFGNVFSWSAFLFVLLLLVIYFSPLAKVKIGGKNATPLLSKWKWFSITLCTTIATGILFWGTAEPLYHYHTPPVGLGFEAASAESRDFAISTLLMHWTFTPYAIYAMVALLFALSYYNHKQPFSLGALLYPVFGKYLNPKISQIVDAICLYCLVAGMAASLGTGILIISGGLHQLFSLNETTFSMGLIAMAIVGTFVLSSVSGLQKGIKTLSDYNIKILIGLILLTLVFGPTGEIIAYAWGGLKDFAINFVPRSTGIGSNIESSWSQSWTVFYWANWMAWAPISALFLGRISRGYTVRQVIHFNLIFPALFSLLWMAIFSTTSIHMDLTNDFALYGTLQESGPQNVIFSLAKFFPLAKVVSVVFLFVAFLSYVTAADSNTSAMSSISNEGIVPENPESPIWTKITWGTLIGMVAWVMVSSSGIDGIKQLSNLGGFPALFLIILVAIGLSRMVLKSFIKRS